MYRQGDVLLTKESVSKADRKKAEAVKPDKAGRLILAEGEATGHAHAIRSRHATLFAIGTVLYLEALRRVTLRHEEHAPVILPPGVYKITRQREYTPEAIRRVMD